MCSKTCYNSFGGKKLFNNNPIVFGFNSIWILGQLCNFKTVWNNFMHNISSACYGPTKINCSIALTPLLTLVIRQLNFHCRKQTTTTRQNNRTTRWLARLKQRRQTTWRKDRIPRQQPQRQVNTIYTVSTNSDKFPNIFGGSDANLYIWKHFLIYK